MRQLDVMDVNQKARQHENEMSEEERRRRMRKIRAKKLAMKRKRRQRRIRLALSVTAILVLVLTVANWKNIINAVQGVGKHDAASDVAAGAAGDAGEDEAGSSLSGAGKSFAGSEENSFLYEVAFEDFFETYEPEVLEEAQVYRRLSVLAGEYEELKEIYENSEKYPVKMLASLCNNPEMYEYVEGYLKYENGDTSVAKTAELTEAEKAQRYPLFLQWDARWGYKEYGDFNIGLSGCGPTTLAMAAVAITGDTSVTPDVVAEYSMKNGFYVEGTGTAWSLMTDGAEAFDLKAKEISLDEVVMKNALDAGKVIICSMRPGDFTSVGHFIMIYDYDANGFKVNDPNCIYRSSRYWSYRELSYQIRILWSYEAA